ncbi:hypothetical protein Q7C36_006283 [Tachysurus vachellii]|uniref:Uncharacterized protein n=1 Tax=Tachysurus vachellii TaxID=175792 RepID=A0AA88NE93_TACVA|nr:hypothetical protein Q7C36_006283 [Tachysurus vachellii]
MVLLADFHWLNRIGCLKERFPVMLNSVGSMKWKDGHWGASGGGKPIQSSTPGYDGQCK